MKAASVHELGLEHPLVVEDVPDPQAGPGQVLVSVRSAGVNPLEISIRSGENPRSKGIPRPFICGSDIAGEVEAVGEGVEGIKAGDRVWGRSVTGGYAEKGVLPADATGILSEGMSFQEGASLPIPLVTAWNALVIKAETGPGETVLVQGGAGGVGHLAIQLARRMGCRVLATVSSGEKGDFCLKAGADAVINYREEDVAARVMEETGGRGVEAIVENAALDNLAADLSLVAVNGRVVIVGTGTGKEGEIIFPVRAAMGRDARVIALSSGHLTPHLPGIIRRLAPLLEGGAIRPRIGKEFPLEAAGEAHELVLSGKFLGKVVLMV